MRLGVTATIAAVGALIAAGVLGVATAEGPTATTPRTVSVQGVALEPIDQSASAVAATAVYRRGMGDAVSDGLSKAQFLASKVGGSLGAVQSVVEDGGSISCAGEAEYQGEAPDFGSPGSALRSFARAAPLRGTSIPLRRRPSARHRHRKSPAAKKANVAVCKLSAQVSLAYALS